MVAGRRAAELAGHGVIGEYLRESRQSSGAGQVYVAIPRESKRQRGSLLATESLKF